MAQQFSPLTYTSSGIVFAKATFDNVNIAQSASGEGVLTDIIAPVTFASGTISLTDLDPVVSGVGTLFTTEFAVGQYLYYYDVTGDPVLAGKILSISSNTTLTLTEDYAGDNQTGVKFGMSETVIGGYENFLVRVPSVINTSSGNCVMPNWLQFMASFTPQQGGFNNPNNINLEQYSVVNNPQTPANSPTDIPIYITPYAYNYQSNIVGNQKLYFTTVNDFPKYSFALINPWGDTDQKLPINTLCRFFFNQNFPLNGVLFTTATPQENLIKAGFIVN